MSKDYRFQSDEWNAADEGEFHSKKPNTLREKSVKAMQKRAMLRRNKQRRSHDEIQHWSPSSLKKIISRYHLVARHCAFRLN